MNLLQISKGGRKVHLPFGPTLLGSITEVYNSKPRLPANSITDAQSSGSHCSRSVLMSPCGPVPHHVLPRHTTSWAAVLALTTHLGRRKYLGKEESLDCHNPRQGNRIQRTMSESSPFRCPLGCYPVIKFVININSHFKMNFFPSENSTLSFFFLFCIL